MTEGAIEMLKAKINPSRKNSGSMHAVELLGIT
jgi:hypothetical protein